MSVTPITAARGAAEPAVEAAEGNLFGKPTEGVIPRHDGKLTLDVLKELFSPFEPAKETSWRKRGLPAPETPIEAIPLVGTCTPPQALGALQTDRERVAFRRHQVAAFAEHCENLVPNGGHSGAWMLFWESDTTLAWAYVYRSASDDVGLLVLDFNADESLPAHQGHVFVVPQKR